MQSSQRPNNSSSKDTGDTVQDTTVLVIKPTRNKSPDTAGDYHRMEEARVVERVSSNPSNLEELVDQVVPGGVGTKKGLIIIVIYILTGVIAYSGFFEKWHVIDSLYFSIVTLTTVGYGDLSPESQGGRAFTSFYATFGLFIIGTIVSSISEEFLDSRVQAQKKANEDAQTAADSILLSSSRSSVGIKEDDALNELKKKQNESLALLSKQILTTSALVTVLFFGGGWLEGKDQEWTLIDNIYFTVVSVTTVGYGDLAPDDKFSRFMAAIYLPFCVASVATIIGKITLYRVDRKANKAQMKFLSQGLTEDDLRRLDKNNDGTVDLAEYLEFMLVAMKKVDEQTFNKLKRQYYSLDVDGDGELTVEDLKQHYRTQVSAVQRAVRRAS